ncbi:MAG: iron transporter [Hyphomicrobiales bacterium]|nr:iron transporter [Rhodoblastus sp.]MCC2112139.1 iron transporter [Hyphomicrobiales bacterium]
MRAFALTLVAAFAATGAIAKEIPLGAPKTEGGMNIAAVYLQPIEMEPEGMMRPARESDVHMEADIKAAKGNTNGFAEGDWIPYLVVNYELTREGGPTQKGEFMPMVANDGPHYGDNVKLSGPGKYKLKLVIQPPSVNKHAHFGRHVDKETGVAEWFKPITVEFEFPFAGTGKKGAY